MKIANQVATVVYDGLRDTLTERIVQTALKAVGKTAVALMQERIMAKRVDINGNKFAPLTSAYKKRKAKLVQKSIKGSTEFRATNVNDNLRLTGQLLKSFRADIVSSKIGKGTVRLQLRLSVSANQARKAEGLLRKRQFFGLSKGGANVRYEQQQLKKVFLREVQQALNTKASITVKT